MKNLLRIASSFFLVAALWACKSSAVEEGSSGEADPEASAHFQQFVAKFTPMEAEFTQTVGEEWIAEITPTAKKMTPEDAKHFVHGNKVINRRFGNGEKIITLDDKTEYYYLHSFKDSAYQSIIISDLKPETTNTYLLNYNNAGRFISGITIQNKYLEKQANGTDKKTTRESIVSSSKSVIVIENTDGSRTFQQAYYILPDGKMDPAE